MPVRTETRASDCDNEWSERDPPDGRMTVSGEAERQEGAGEEG